MNAHRVWIGLLVLSVLFGLSAAQAQGTGDDGAAAYARGDALLKKGDLEGALEAYASAAGAPDAAPEHKQKYLRVRRVIKLREAITGETNPEKWWKTAATLRNFYYSLRLYEDLLELAGKMHERKPSVGTATLTADALLMLGRNAEAEKTLADVKRSDLTLQARALLGVAMARQKKIDEARALLDAMEIPVGVSARFLYDVARLKVLTGDVEGGMATLTTAFERTNPKGLKGFKAFVKNTADFAGLPASARFARVLETTSKVKESSCSGGASCGSCPKSGSCAGSKKK